MLKIAAIALCASIASGAGAQSPRPAQAWYGAGHVALTATDAAGGLAAEWQFDRANNGDVRIAKNEQHGAAKANGLLLSVCDDQALLFKDIVPVQRHELQELNEPVLYLQLALRLLARAMPQGLPAAGTQTSIDVSEDKNTLRVRRGNSARKDLGAPWRARGTASRGAAGEVRFDLVVTHAAENAPGRQSELKLAGVWEQQSRMTALDNAFDLTGWRVHRVDTIAEVVGGNTILDFDVKTAPQKFATLGDVRAAIGRWWDPDVKASKRTECGL
jgi:hypothetical protein